MLGHGDEGLFHVGGVEGGSLQKGDPHFIRQFLTNKCARIVYLSRRILHRPFRRQVTLVSHQELADALTAVPLHLLQPHANVGKRLGVGNVIDDNNAVGAAVIGGGDGAEAFLAGGVPYLELDGLAFQVNCADFKVDADGADEAFRIRVVREPKQ